MVVFGYNRWYKKKKNPQVRPDSNKQTNGVRRESFFFKVDSKENDRVVFFFKSTFATTIIIIDSDKSHQ